MNIGGYSVKNFLFGVGLLILVLWFIAAVL